MTRSSATPRRVQLRRTRGWKMPSNTVKVSRPGPWGNPYKVDSDHTLAMVVQSYRLWVAYEIAMHRLNVEPLRGKNLACWCALDQPCHADVLLEIANGC